MKELYSLTERNYVVDMGKIDYLCWVIRSTGDHPCAYIGGKKLLPRDELDQCLPISITYDSREYGTLEGLDPSLEWIGWDYGHPGDYEAYYEKDPDKWKENLRTSKKYTYKDIRVDIDWSATLMLALPFVQS